MVDQDAPHDVGRCAKEMSTVLPVNLVVSGQPHISFVDQGAGMKRVPVSCPTHVVAGEAVQLLINQWDELFFRLLVALLYFGQKQGNGVRRIVRRSRVSRHVRASTSGEI